MIKIVCEGKNGFALGRDAKITCRGRKVSGVNNIKLDIGVDRLVEADMKVYPQQVEIEGAQIRKLSLIDLWTGEEKEVESIKFKDGSEWPSPDSQQ